MVEAGLVGVDLGDGAEVGDGVDGEAGGANGRVGRAGFEGGYRFDE